MEHTAQDGSPKLLADCTLPLTGKKIVNRVITNLGIIELTSAGFQVVELAPEVSEEEMTRKTGGPITFKRQNAAV